MRVASITLRAGSKPGNRFYIQTLVTCCFGFPLEAVEKRPFAEVVANEVGTVGHEL